MRPKPGTSRFSKERELEDYIVAHPDLLESIVVRRQPLTPCNGQPDVLMLDGTATLDGVELKHFSTSDKTMGQLLDYADWGDQLTMEDLTRLAAGNANPIDLPVAFEKRFGRPLPTQLNGRPRVTLIASMFDRRTFHGIQYLQRQGVPIRALRYVEDRGSVKVLPFTAEDLDREWRRSLLGGLSTPGRLKARWLPSTYAVHEDVRDFWAHFSCQFVWDFVPFSFVFKLYEAWRHAEELAGHPRISHQWGQFGRQLSHLVVESGEWIHHQRFRAGSLMDAYEPLADGLSTWRPALPDHSVAGYLRKAAIGQ